MPKKKIVITLLCIITLITALPINAYASVIPEDELKTQVESKSKAEVSGNVFIWFLCAVAFLKISQKIDSFMGSLGINVGNTGGSMLGEIMLAARGLSVMKNIGKGGAGGSAGSAASGNSQSSGQGTGFASGTFTNMVRRNPANNANISNNPTINQNAGNPALNISETQTNNAFTGNNNGNLADIMNDNAAIMQNISEIESAVSAVLRESHDGVLAAVETEISEFDDGTVTEITDEYRTDIFFNSNLIIAQYCAYKDNYEDIYSVLQRYSIKPQANFG